MASEGFSLTLDDTRFKSLLNRLKFVSQDMRPAFAEIVRWNEKYNRSQFSLKGAGKYAPLSEKYKAWKTKKFGARPILVMRGFLANSVTLSGSFGAVRLVSKDSMVLGSRLPYAPFIQGGTKKMEARPFLFWDKPRIDATNKIMHTYLHSALSKELQIK